MARKRSAAIWLGFGAAAIAGIGLVVSFFDVIVMRLLTPSASFDASDVPREPDYANPDAWTALPDRVDSADAALPEFPALDQALAPADVFYVHPTTYVGAHWNAAIDDPALNEATDRVATLIQASAFNACCAIYGPRYRQANGSAYTEITPDGRGAAELAYRDVANAFRHYLAHHGRGRPFILASHSQGSAHARRLLREEISGTELRGRLVAAYLIGIPITMSAFGREAPDVPPCDSPTQTACVVTWNARGPDYEPRLDILEEAAGPLGADPDPLQHLCVNPLTWARDEIPAGVALNQGAIFLEADPPTLKPRFANARCYNGRLVVSEIGRPPRDFMSRILDFALGSGNYHPVEYQIFYLNLRSNAGDRVAAYLKLERQRTASRLVDDEA